MKTVVKYMTLTCSILALFGCGGGGGSSSSDSSAKPTAAVLKLSTQGTLAQGNSIAGIGITVNLPAGVTVKTAEDGSVGSGVVTGSGGTATSATVTPPEYTPATATTPAKLSFVLASTAAEGFPTGEFATVNCNVVSGTPTATDVTLTDFKPIDTKGAPITGLSATHTADIK